MQRNWTATQWRFIEWLATPKFYQELPTEEALANRLGVTTRTLRRWKELDGFMDEFRRIIKSHLSEHIPDILCGQTLVVRAPIGDMS